MRNRDLSGDLWHLSPYPDGFDWAFTIVHDADDSYSLRLAPIIDAFDKYGIKSTITVFVFWNDAVKVSMLRQIRNGSIGKPKSVPLENQGELTFYYDVMNRGHEIGMHTARDGHAERSVTEFAFEFFHSKFGFYPPIYVEHRDNLQNVQFYGADPESPYYIVDLLNKYRSWVWIVSPSSIPYAGKGDYYNVLSRQDSILGHQLSYCWGGSEGIY